MAAKSKKTVKKAKQAAKKSPAKKTAKPATKKTAKPAAKKPAAKATASKAKLQAVPSLRKNYDNVLTPLDDRILVAIDGAASMTAGGLYIPDSAADRPSRGQVLAKGRGRRNKKGQIRPLDVQVGDKVLYAAFSGTKITVGGDELLILREDEVLGIVT